jgi:hypothetical protein
LLAIGYNVTERRRDTSFYDLLASEARLASFLGVAHGQLPQETWFALGRLLTLAGGDPVLVSWSGSMFEYLMPQLVMPSYRNTLLDQTNRAAVRRQIEYGNQRVAWGMSSPVTHGRRQSNYHIEPSVPGGATTDWRRHGRRPYASAPVDGRTEAAATTCAPAAGAYSRFGLHGPSITAVADTARQPKRYPLVYVAPPGHEPAVVRGLAARSSLPAVHGDPLFQATLMLLRANPAVDSLPRVSCCR